VDLIGTLRVFGPSRIFASEHNQTSFSNRTQLLVHGMFRPSSQPSRSAFILFFVTSWVLVWYLFYTPPPAKHSTDNSIYQFSVKDIDGNVVSLDKYQDKVILVSNVASE
jgi:hypothetical protein